MKIGAIPETILERIALPLGLVPTPLVDTSATFILARTILTATKLGLFEALAGRARTAVEVATVCATDVTATSKLLDALVSAGYLRAGGGHYRLAPVARTWLLQASRMSLYDALLFADIEWGWMTRLEDFVRTGKPLDFHTSMTPDEWGLYQRAMRSLANIGAPEVARKLPVPLGARDVLDIGGGHGHYSAALCRRHSKLHATVLDLPQAIEHAAPLLAQEGMGRRVVHWAGDALVENLGNDAYDVVLIAQLVHHFDETTNRALVQRVARALRPGGYLAILEPMRPESCSTGSQIDGLLGLYFAFTSRAGTWGDEAIAEWQRAAGLQPHKLIRFLKMPGVGAQTASRPG
jgi:SAM-dependent methyltransferase